MEPKGIDELLSDAPLETYEEERQPEPEPESGQPRDENGRFATKQTGVDEEPQATAPQEPTDAGPPPADQLPKEEYVALKAVRNENRELKEAIAAMQAQMAAFQQRQPAPQAEPEPDFWDNPQGVIASQVQRAVMEALQAKEQQQQLARINESEAKAKAAYADYDDAFRAFQQAAAANPSLIQQMTAASDPAEFAYKKGKTALQLEQVGSIDEIIAKRLADERAKWEAEVKAAVPQPSFPSTTATDGSVGARSGPAWSGPAPIGDLLR